MNPKQITTGKRISQRLKRYYPARQAPVVFMCGACGGCLLERHPASLPPHGAHPRTVRQATQPNVQLLRAKARRPDLGEILQLEKNFAVCSLTISMNNRFALFVVLRQRPGRDCLNVASTKARTAIRIKHVATSRLIQNGPNFQSISKLPATTMQHCAPPIELCGFALVAGALRKVVESFFAGDFQAYSFKRRIH